MGPYPVRPGSLCRRFFEKDFLPRAFILRERYHFLSQEPPAKSKSKKKKAVLADWKTKLANSRKKQLLYKKKAVEFKEKLEVAKTEASENVRRLEVTQAELAELWEKNSDLVKQIQAEREASNRELEAIRKEAKKAQKLQGQLVEARSELEKVRRVSQEREQTFASLKARISELCFLFFHLSVRLDRAIACILIFS